MLDKPVSGAEGQVYVRHSHREKDDAYHWVIVQVDDRTRVIDCRDGIHRAAAWCIRRWKGLSFCRTRAALIRDTRRRYGADLPPDALVALMALPERHR
jgi:hypothetical protein